MRFQLAPAPTMIIDAVCTFYDVQPDDFKKTQKGDVQRASQCSGLSDAKDQERSFKGDWRAVWSRKIQFGEQHDRRDQTAAENRSKLQETHQ